MRRRNQGIEKTSAKNDARICSIAKRKLTSKMGGATEMKGDSKKGNRPLEGTPEKKQPSKRGGRGLNRIRGGKARRVRGHVLSDLCCAGLRERGGDA